VLAEQKVGLMAGVKDGMTVAQLVDRLDSLDLPKVDNWGVLMVVPLVAVKVAP
jgi:hypothetical protein